MAFGVTLKTNGAGGNTSTTTASISGTAGNTLYIMGIGTPPSDPAGYGSTAVATGANVSAPWQWDQASGLWYAPASGVASTIVITQAYGAPYYRVYEVTGGATSIVQSKRTFNPDGVQGITATVTLDAAITPGNFTLATISNYNAAAITPAGGWTETVDVSFSPYGFASRIEDQYILAGTATASGTWTGSSNWYAEVIEIGLPPQPVGAYPSGNDAQAEATVGAWTADVNCSVSRSTTMFDQGVASVRLSSTAGGDMSAKAPGDGTSGRQWYRNAPSYLSVRCKVKSGSVARMCNLRIKTWDANGSLVASYEGPQVLSSTTDWTTLQILDIPQKPSAVQATYYTILVVVHATGGAAELHYFDSFHGVVANAAGGYNSSPNFYDWRSTFDWQVRVSDAAGNWSDWSPVQSFTSTPKPTVTVTAPTGAQGVSRPIVSWNFRQSALAYTQQKYRIKIFDAATYGGGGFSPDTSTPTWDSGWVTGFNTTDQVDAVLLNGGTYRAYVMVQSTSGQASAWAFSGFTVSYTVPTTPTVVVTPANGVNMVVITSAINGSPTFSLQRSLDGGLTWTDVRGAVMFTGEQATDGGSGNPAKATVFDREAPLNVNIRYRAWVNNAGLYSLVGSTSDAKLIEGSWWIRDPLTPSRDTNVAPSAVSFETKGGVQGTRFDPIGRSLPVVIFGNTPIGDTFKLSSHLLDQTKFLRLKALLEAKSTLFIQSVHGMTWYARVTGTISFNQVQASPVKNEGFPVRHYYTIECDLDEVEAP